MGQVFEYKVRNRQGAILRGRIEAENRQLVIEKLREQNYIITSLQEKVKAKDVSDTFAGIMGANLKDLVVFSRQFSTMINAGLPILRCLDILSQQTASKALREALADLKKEVEGGSSLAAAMGKCPKVFPELFVTMVNAGEVGGLLDKTMDRLAEHYEKELELREKVKTATRYPSIVAVIAIVIVILMLSTVVPTFAEMFGNMGMELPVATRILLAISKGFTTYGWVLLAVLAAAGYGVYRYFQTKEGQANKDNIIEKMPVFGQLTLKINIARICRTLGTLMSSGVPILQALDVVKTLTATTRIRQGLEKARNNISEGEGMAKPLEDTGVFPPMVTQMIAVGEETGNIDGMLIKVADFYDKEVKNTTDGLSSMIEPILIGFLALVVGGIVVATILPVFQLYGKIGTR
ncbi:MAG TPA: type II secretion system F family protein [Bacillota bacterium]|nr:type II secretion system F family protein [Bacillota bacterium]